MGYSSRKGKKPAEYASKASHQSIIKDPKVIEFLSGCHLPEAPDESCVDICECVTIPDEFENPIKHIFAIDGGYSEVPVKSEYPSATIAFIQFGVLMLKVSDLIGLSKSKFIFPEQMSKLKNMDRFKLALPTRGIIAKSAETLTDSVRHAIRDFFLSEPKDSNLMETLKWFIFEEYDQPLNSWNIAGCPLCESKSVKLQSSKVDENGNQPCEKCGRQINLIDVFRLHEAIDNFLGAGGILGYLVTLLEQMMLVHVIRIILNTRPALLEEILFIKDGPLAYFGQTANMQKPMRNLVKYLQDKHNLFLVGSEKSGPFVEHADAIARHLGPCSVLILNNEYITKHIVPGRLDPARPYGASTYYGAKLIFKTKHGEMYVLTLPTPEVYPNPKSSDLMNLEINLCNLASLKCDMYDSALVPIALVNKLVSISDHPSGMILEKFARSEIES
ncbi:MAG: NurA domain-containing protein [Planctomycetota bacterium]|nr:MAG: NurA domain-containing protein [Planctomycetota bacterium]